MVCQELLDSWCIETTLGNLPLALLLEVVTKPLLNNRQTILSVLSVELGKVAEFFYVTLLQYLYNSE